MNINWFVKLSAVLILAASILYLQAYPGPMVYPMFNTGSRVFPMFNPPPDYPEETDQRLSNPAVDGPVIVYSDTGCVEESGRFESIEDLKREMTMDEEAQDKYISLRSSNLDGPRFCYLIDWRKYGKHSNPAVREIRYFNLAKESNVGSGSLPDIAPELITVWENLGEPNDHVTPDEYGTCKDHWSEGAVGLEDHRARREIHNQHPDWERTMGVYDDPNNTIIIYEDTIEQESGLLDMHQNCLAIAVDMEENMHASQEKAQNSLDWIRNESEAREKIEEWWGNAFDGKDPPFIKVPGLDELMNSKEFEDKADELDELQDKRNDNGFLNNTDKKRYKDLNDWFRERNGSALAYPNPEFNKYDPCICPPSDS